MAEPPPRQGWRVPQRTPFIAAAAILALIVAMLLTAGTIYRHTLGERRHQPVAKFPGPGVEDYIHDGRGDPEQPLLRPPPDPAIEAAKRAVAREGIAGWPG